MQILTSTIKNLTIIESKDIKKSKSQLPFVMKELGKKYGGECFKAYNSKDINISFGVHDSNWIKLDDNKTDELGEHKYDLDKSCYAIGVSVKCDASKKIMKPKKGEVFKIKDLNIKYAGIGKYINKPEFKYLNFVIYTDPMV